MILNEPLSVFHLFESGVIPAHTVTGKSVTVTLVLPHSVNALYFGWIRKRDLRNGTPIEKHGVKFYTVSATDWNIDIWRNTLSVENCSVLASAVSLVNVSIVQQENLRMIGTDVIVWYANCAG